MVMLVVIAIGSVSLMGCPPVVKQLTVDVQVWDGFGETIFPNQPIRVNNPDKIIIPANENEITARLVYDGIELERINATFFLKDESGAIAISVFDRDRASMEKTWEEDDAWAIAFTSLITLGIITSVNDFQFESIGDFNTFDFYCAGTSVDLIMIEGVTDGGMKYTTYFEWEGAISENDYTLSTSTQGNGSVTGAGIYSADTEVEVRAFPADGWEFDHWTVNGTLGTSLNPATVTMEGDITVTAIFTEIESEVVQYTLTTSTEGQGSVNGAGVYDAGTNVEVRAFPADGWEFDHWTVNGTLGTSLNPATVNMGGHTTVTAIFTEIEGEGEEEGEVDPGDKIIIDLTWDGETLEFDATNAGNKIGIGFFLGSSPWEKRYLYTTTGGTVTGTIGAPPERLPNIIRFGVIYGPTPWADYVLEEDVEVYINGIKLKRNVPDPDPQNSGLAYQVDLSTLIL